MELPMKQNLLLLWLLYELILASVIAFVLGWNWSYTELFPPEWLVVNVVVRIAFIVLIRILMFVPTVAVIVRNETKLSLARDRYRAAVVKNAQQRVAS